MGGGRALRSHVFVLTQVKLLFFAKSRECVGESEVDFEWTDKTSVSGQNLLDSILSSYPR